MEEEGRGLMCFGKSCKWNVMMDIHEVRHGLQKAK